MRHHHSNHSADLRDIDRIPRLQSWSMPAAEPKLEVRLKEGVAEVPAEAWDALGGPASPFTEWAFLASLEEAGTLGGESGWDARPLLGYADEQLVAACPLYIKSNSEGEFVFDHGWADAAYRAGISYYPKLLVGAPFSPVTGARFLVHPDADGAEWTARLGHALREICGANSLSGAHVNFCHESEAAALESLGFHTRIGLQYHWHNPGFSNFEDYLASFRSKRRNQIRRERREMERQNVEIKIYMGDAVTADLVEPMFRFYLATIESRHWGRQYLNRAFFELLFERFKDRLVLVIAEQDGKKIAGTLNVQKGDALYGRYWGATRDVRHLHFNVCYYKAVEHCIEQGLARFEPGAGGEYKQVRGFDASPTYSAHYLDDPRLASAVEQSLESERAHATETIDWYRDHSALKSPAPRESGSPTEAPSTPKD